MAGAVRRSSTEDGTTLVDVLIVAMVVGVLIAVTTPLTATTIDAGRARHAAAFVGSRFRLARQEAVSRSANVGVVFDQIGSRWSFRVCRDGNGNGLRRADIQAGTDPCFEGPHVMSDLFPGIEIAVDPDLRGPSGEAGSPDPVRFGSSNLMSFSPLGSCTSGSLFLRSRIGVQYIVRVAGGTGRVRVLVHEPAGGWREP